MFECIDKIISKWGSSIFGRKKNKEVSYINFDELEKKNNIDRIYFHDL